MAPVTFATREQALAAFQQLLDQKGIDLSYTWEEALCVLVTSPVYRALTMTEKRQAFAHYLEHKKELQQGNRIKKYEIDREKLRRLFSTRDGITGSTRFAQVFIGNLSRNRYLAQILASDPVYRSTEPDFREKIFEEYAAELRRREKESLTLARKDQLAKLKDLLKTMPITLTTTWKEAQPMIVSHRAYSTLNYLHPVDTLEVFEDYMNGLEKQVRDEYAAKASLRHRAQRKRREAFRKLLKHYCAQGTLRAYTQWKDLIQAFEKEEAYMDILGQPGSTPLDLFRDVIVHLQDECAPERREIIEMTKTHGITVTPKLSFSDFQLKLSELRSGFVKDSLQVVYNQLMDKHLVREREEKRKEAKKVKRRMDAFKSLLKRVDPPITQRSSWQEVVFSWLFIPTGGC